MRRLLFLMPILLCAAVSAHAQSLDAFKQRLAEPTPGATLFNRAQVTVTAHDDAARAVADAARATALKALEASDSGGTDWLPQNPRGQYKLCRSTLDARERGEFVEPDILAWAQTFVHSNTYQGFALADGQALAANG